MINGINRNTLKFWTEKEMKVEAAHLLDLCENVLNTKKRLVTPFLSPAMANWFQTVLEDTSLRFLFWGGFEDAERVRVVLGEQGNDLTPEDTEIDFVQVIPNKKDVILGHRDILGSLIGLGLERDVIGDIRQGQSGSIIAVTCQMQDYITQNLTHVGRENIRTFMPGSCQILPIAGVEKRIVTASSRLDAVAATGFGASRSMMQSFIQQGKVKKNDLESLKPEMDVRAGDTISCRGKGKLKILEADTTKKGKSAWRIFIYSDQERR